MHGGALLPGRGGAAAFLRSRRLSRLADRDRRLALAWVPKAVGFLAIVRALTAVLAAKDMGDPLMQQAIILSWVIAAATMIWGNFVALLQENLKRLLAYSSIAHAGYMMVGVTAAFCGESHGGGVYYGSEGVLFYLVAYALMTLGVFGVFSAVRIEGRVVETVDDLSGLGWTHPLAGLALVDLFVELERNSAAGRLLGEVRGLLVAAGRRPARPIAIACRAGRDRMLSAAARSVLLPADRRRHVSASRQGRGHARGRLAGGPGRRGVRQADAPARPLFEADRRGARAAAIAAMEHPHITHHEVAAASGPRVARPGPSLNLNRRAGTPTRASACRRCPAASPLIILCDGPRGTEKRTVEAYFGFKAGWFIPRYPHSKVEALPG